MAILEQLAPRYKGWLYLNPEASRRHVDGHIVPSVEYSDTWSKGQQTLPQKGARSCGLQGRALGTLGSSQNVSDICR